MRWWILSFGLFLGLWLKSPTYCGATATKDNTGSRLPKLAVDYVANKPSSLNGKPKIVEFWATWCGPCVRNIPHLNELHDRFASRGLVIIGVSDEHPENVKDFAKEHSMRYAVAVDRRKDLSIHFGIKSIPHALLVDASDRIIWEGHPSKLPDELIESALSGTASAAPSPAPASQPRSLPKVL